MLFVVVFHVNYDIFFFKMLIFAGKSDNLCPYVESTINISHAGMPTWINFERSDCCLNEDLKTILIHVLLLRFLLVRSKTTKIDIKLLRVLTRWQWVQSEGIYIHKTQVAIKMLIFFLHLLLRVYELLFFFFHLPLNYYVYAPHNGYGFNSARIFFLFLFLLLIVHGAGMRNMAYIMLLFCTSIVFRVRVQKSHRYYLKGNR